MIMKEDRDEYIAVFISDCNEYLSKISQDMYHLEAEPNNQNLINEIFRSIHSIKGAAGFLEYKILTKISHEFESLLGNMREGTVVINNEISDLMAETVNVIEKMLKYIEENGAEVEMKNIKKVIGMSEKEFNSLIERFIEVQGSDVSKVKTDKNRETIKSESFSQNEESVLPEAEEEHVKHTVINKLYKISITVKDDVAMKSVIMFIFVHSLKEMGKIVYLEPTEKQMEEGKVEGNEVICIFDTAEKEDKILKNISSSEIEKKKIEKLNLKIFDSEEYFEQGIENEEDKSKNGKKESSKIKEFIKIEKKKLDNIMDTVGELVIDKSRYNQMRIELKNIHQRLLEKGIDKNDLKELWTFIENFKKINKNLEREAIRLQDEATSMRIFPIKDLFSRFPRSAREIAHRLGKDVEMETHGEDTELDKVIIEGLMDPIMHMIRNSIDHGIETTEERVKAGKPKKGKIILEAFNIGNEIIIRVSDDGKGIDADKVAKKAIEKKIKTEEQIKSMSNDEKLELIFLPGFSTAENVSDISGRGVGMDVVKSNIRAMKGRVDIETVVGHGTVFTVSLPLTLAITRALLIENNHFIYSIPLDSIVTIVTVTKEKLESINKRDMIRLRDRVVPIFDIDIIFNIKREKDDKILNVVILRMGDDMYGFRVDRFIGQQEIVIKNIEGNYHKGKGIVGATILGDGKVAMVIDSNELVEYYEENIMEK